MKSEQRLARIERKRAALLDDVGRLNQVRLDARPRPGKWSVREIVEHLVRVEQDVVGDTTTLSTRSPRRRRLKHRVLRVIVMVVLRFDIPVQVPSQGMVPLGGRSLAELGATWEEQHRLLREFVRGLDAAGERRAIIRHPACGPISVRQAMMMLEIHLDRHTRQIRRLVALTG